MSDYDDRMKVAVVDDDEFMNRFITESLEVKDYQVISFTNPLHALDALARDRNVTIAIIDVHMPEMNGLEFVSQAMSLNPKLATIVITGDQDIEIAIEAIRCGACDFVQKPLDLVKLITAVEEAEQNLKLRRKLEEAPAFQDKEEDEETQKRILDYLIFEKIDEGAAGNVYLCLKEHDTCKYAVKVMKSVKESSGSQNRSKRFMNEGRALTSIRHPNVVQLVEQGIFSENGMQFPYIVMEYFDGHKLSQYLDDITRLDLMQKVSIIKQIAQGLEAVHEKGIYHRDIKPENILINDHLQVVIVDFGVCHLPLSELTITNSLIGTPCYLSPEMVHSGSASKLSDLYALGVIAYELFLGVKPFNHDNFHVLVHKIVHEYPAEPRVLNPEFPLDLQNILAKLLMKNPKKRYQAAHEVVRDLEKFMESTSHSTLYEQMKHVVMYQQNWSKA